MKFLLTVFIAAYCFTFQSCTHKSSSTDNEEDSVYVYKSQSYKLVEKHISEMAKNSWNKSFYLEIRDKQIPMLKKNSERLSASTFLETEYSKVLVRDANKILTEGCNTQSPHSLLKNLMLELEKYPTVPGLSELKSLKKTHDDALNFVNSGIGHQYITSYRTSYDEGYESNKMSRAKKYLDNSQIKCGLIRKKLSNLSQSSAYTARRRAYCEMVTELYLQSENTALSELNAAKASLNIYHGDKSAWKSKMEEHYNELNKNNE